VIAQTLFADVTGRSNPSHNDDGASNLSIMIKRHGSDTATFQWISEITELEWSQVDRKQGIVRLEVGEINNDDARTVYLDGELEELLELRWERRIKLGTALPYVFLNSNGKDRVKRFDKAWKTACIDAGISVKLFHDFRRSAVRNMVHSGIPERVAMMISGHKTRNVFDRYNIVSDEDLRLAAKRRQAYLESQTVTRTVTMKKTKTRKPASRL